MESTLQNPAIVGANTGYRKVSVTQDLRVARPRGVVVGFWIATALFCLQMGFTAYAQLRLPHRSCT